MRSVKTVIDEQYAQRVADADGTYLKINLYKGYEVEAVAAALAADAELEGSCRVESMMVADSYLTTHMGRASTVLKTLADQARFLDVMYGLLVEVRAAIDASFPAAKRPLLMSDMPDGTTTNPQIALDVAAEFAVRGADTIKVEAPTDETLAVIEAMTREGHAVVAHIGYAPQTGENRRYGESIDSALELFARARRARDAGACQLVLERVDENVSRALCASHENGRLIYSIFSGRARHGGQSLNVFDSVFLPPFKARYFPPTARYALDRYPHAYIPQTIAACMGELMRLTVQGRYPKSPPSKLSLDEIAFLQRIDPWAETAPATLTEEADV